MTLTARPASGVPRACSFDFIRMPGTLAIVVPKSGGSTKVSSAVWLAGSEASVLRRIESDIFRFRSGISMSARTPISGGWPAGTFTASVRQITVPTYCLPCGTAGSSSYSTTRCATGAICVAPGWPTRSGIFGRVPLSLGASACCCCAGLVSERYSDSARGAPHTAAPIAMTPRQTAIAVLSGKPPLFFSGSSRGAIRTRDLSPG